MCYQHSLPVQKTPYSMCLTVWRRDPKTHLFGYVLRFDDAYAREVQATYHLPYHILQYQHSVAACPIPGTFNRTPTSRSRGRGGGTGSGEEVEEEVVVDGREVDEDVVVVKKVKEVEGVKKGRR
eukprot:2553183-Rhodomonas_salina.1